MQTVPTAGPTRHEMRTIRHKIRQYHRARTERMPHVSHWAWQGVAKTKRRIDAASPCHPKSATDAPVVQRHRRVGLPGVDRLQRLCQFQVGRVFFPGGQKSVGRRVGLGRRGAHRRLSLPDPCQSWLAKQSFAEKLASVTQPLPYQYYVVITAFRPRCRGCDRVLRCRARWVTVSSNVHSTLARHAVPKTTAATKENRDGPEDT